jgi:hypothetical protein
VKRPGDPIELGDILGHPQEPYERYARVVAIRKDDCRPMQRVIFRLFRNKHEKWPTGEYRNGAFICAWESEEQ